MSVPAQTFQEAVARLMETTEEERLLLVNWGLTRVVLTREELVLFRAFVRNVNERKGYQLAHQQLAH